MVEYRIRLPYRIAAWLPAALLIQIGVSILVLGVGELGQGELVGILAILGGLLAGAAASLFARIAWTGRVPASVEEYGLDGPGEVEESRAAARRGGRLLE
jgi:hypothetical protein